ncbi:hypothetical protein BDSB_20900 [Burkholderia dolosa PC543]|nr:hypothetical protein BDSB_20900 [Burkholderia dolosa PC543]
MHAHMFASVSPSGLADVRAHVRYPAQPLARRTAAAPLASARRLT